MLGREVRNIYGRTLGRIVGLERNSFGELEGVQVESVGGQIITGKARQLALTPNSITLTPEWKIESEDLISELSLLRKRVTALESLRNSGEIDTEIYAELLDSQRAGYLEKVKAAEGLTNSVKNRLVEITSQISSLSKYLVNAKLDHKSGELDEASLKLAEKSIGPTLGPLIAERNDLSSSLKILEDALPTKVNVS